MKNTGIEYSSADRIPVVLPEMAQLLPPLTEEQLAALEADLLSGGCYSPIIVNEDLVIIDGHHRHELCEKHGIPYKMAVFSFEDMLEAKQWALDTQKGRRNLDKWELGKIALKLREDIEAKAKANMGTRTDLSAILPKGSDPIDTRKKLAEAVGLGERTMGKVMQIDEHAPAPMLFPLEDVKLDMGGLAMWRLQTHETFGGTWLSDYVPNRLGGFVHEQAQQKPQMRLIGEDGNIFAILGRASRLLNRAGMKAQSDEMFRRVTACGDYYEALNIISEYVETELSPPSKQSQKSQKKETRSHER